MSAIRRRWRFTGTVQGVGFRYYARAAALHLGLTGWVANNWDGSVTLEAQGERAALDALVPLIERSNRWARIENVEVTTLPVKEHEYGFGERRVNATITTAAVGIFPAAAVVRLKCVPYYTAVKHPITL